MYTRNHWFYRLLSTVLSLVLLLQMLSAQALATERSTVNDSAATNEDIRPPVTVLGEDETMRSETGKHFALSDGSFVAVNYGVAVHYLDENEQWQEIDNRPTPSATQNTYVARNGDAAVVYSADLSSGRVLTASYGDVSVTMGLLDANQALVMTGGTVSATAQAQLVTSDLRFDRAASAAVQTAAQTADDTQTEAGWSIADLMPPGLSSTVVYEDVYPGIDLEYTAYSHNIKEQIIVNQAQTAYRYDFSLALDGLIPALQSDGSVTLSNEDGQVIYRIPAPYMEDSAGAYSTEVSYSLSEISGGAVLTVIADADWINHPDRVLPVRIDPTIVLASGNANEDIITAFAMEAAADDNTQGRYTLCVGNSPYEYNGSDGAWSSLGRYRLFVYFNNLPQIPSGSIVTEATFSMYNHQYVQRGVPQLPVVAYDVTTSKPAEYADFVTWFRAITWNNQPTWDATHAYDSDLASYNYGYCEWDLTNVAKKWYYEDDDPTIALIAANESSLTMDVHAAASFKAFSGGTPPMLTVCYRSDLGLESYYDYSTASAGRAGTGYVNNYTGNLVWTRGDIGFGGNRMPVSISHVYNANDSQTNEFGLGYGWRTNFHQRIYSTAVGDTTYYCWEDADGTRHYFFPTGIANEYRDEENMNLTLEITKSGSTVTGYTIEDLYGNTHVFDGSGRLISQKNNQTVASSIDISYNGNKITQISDGAGRKYDFVYTNDLLSRISYKSTGESEISYLTFGYTNSDLTTVTDKDGKSSTYTYSGHLLTSAADIDGYKLCYTYDSTADGKNSRVTTVSEWDSTNPGGTLAFEYAHNQTTLTDHNDLTQILQFNHWGNLKSVQDGLGRGQFAQYDRMSAGDEDKTVPTEEGTRSTKANQLNLSSKLQNTVSNLISNSSFESDGVPTDSSGTKYGPTDAKAYHGSRCFYITRETAGYTVAPHPYVSVAAGETVTFSGYVNAENAAARIGLFNGSSYVIISEALPAGTGWTRMEVSYTNDTGAAVSIRGVLSLYTAGTAYIDCIQMEKMPTASRYNLVENGDFRDTSAWSSTSGRTTLNTVAAPQLSNNVYLLTGNPAAQNRISQTVQVSGTEGDTFVLAGWAKGDAAAFREAETDRNFGLIATFLDTSGNAVGDPITANFNPDVNQAVSWQYAATALVAPGDYASIKVEIAYDYNINTAYFDGIQLYKEQFGQSYTYDENGNIKAVRDIQGQDTTYDYDANNNLIGQTLPNGARLEYTYDEHHNILTSTSGTGVAYSFTYDDYGNNTSVSIEYYEDINENGTEDDGERFKITSSAVYTEDHNRLEKSIDALGKITQYQYNEDTNVLEWVKYPNDTDTTKTSYTYDTMYRLASSAATTNTGSVLTAQYTYENDYLTAIQTASTTYGFEYGDFGLRESISAGDNLLASYEYTDDANRYLLKLTYGNNGFDALNNDWVSYTYDDYGRVIGETWGNDDTVAYKYDNSGGLASIFDSATGRTTSYYYDLTDRLMKYAVTGSSYKHSVGYKYDISNNLLSLVEDINDTALTTSYTYDQDNRVTSVTTVIKTVEGGNPFTTTVTETYTYDEYGRVSVKQTKKGSGEDAAVVLTETYAYKNHPETGMPTNQLASVSVALANKTIAYSLSYDDNGNIISYFDGTHEITYVYDSANQLIRENNPRRDITYTWEYDNAGNILTYAEYAYTTESLGTAPTTKSYDYGEKGQSGGWGDLLTTYDGKDFTHDTIGNLTDDETWDYTWEKGRQLASMTDGTTTWTFTYDADGMRTGRSNGTTAYTYTYNGGQLSQMTVNGKNVTFSYDASGNPQTMTYDGVTYYYITNPMGDVTGIANESGTQLVFYYYTAYGTAYVSYNTAYQALGATLSGVNPLFYRGYVYDQETGLYYLQSRYYNPKVGRFINADALVATGQGLLGNNMFAYCLNNPVLFTDPSGEASTTFGAESTASARVPWKSLIAAGAKALGYIALGAMCLARSEEALDAASLVERKEALRRQRQIDSLNKVNDNLKNHIIKGTKNKHGPGWQKFDIDPNDPNAWALIIPLIEDVIENADDITYAIADNGGTIIRYFKTYAAEGVQIMVKFWIDVSGSIIELSDVIPKII